MDSNLDVVFSLFSLSGETDMTCISFQHIFYSFLMHMVRCIISLFWVFTFCTKTRNMHQNKESTKCNKKRNKNSSKVVCIAVELWLWSPASYIFQTQIPIPNKHNIPITKYLASVIPYYISQTKTP